MSNDKINIKKCSYCGLDIPKEGWCWLELTGLLAGQRHEGCGICLRKIEHACTTLDREYSSIFFREMTDRLIDGEYPLSEGKFE